MHFNVADTAGQPTALAVFAPIRRCFLCPVREIRITSRNEVDYSVMRKLLGRAFQRLQCPID